MQYMTHPDFIPSVYSMYQKGGRYIKKAERALTIWAKAQHHNIFPPKEVLRANVTKYGENRISYCRKYDFSDGCRLITIFKQDINTHVLLFLGTHQECDEWLDRNRGTDFFNLLGNPPALPGRRA